MGIIFDIAIILSVALSTYLGYKKGLVSAAVKLIAFIAALLITFILYRPIANIVINSTRIDENLSQAIQTNVEKYISGESENKTQNTIVQSAKEGMLPETSRTLAINIIYALTGIVLYAIARICLILINFLAGTIAKLPIIKQFNKLGGAIYGVLRGLLITYAILMVISLVISAKPESRLNEIIGTSHLAKSMTTYNVLNLFLK